MSLFSKVANPLAPYMVWIKLGLIAAVFLIGMRAGCSIQKSADADKIADADKRHGQDVEIHMQDEARLKAAAKAITAVNEAAARAIAASKAAEALANESSKVAAVAAEDARKKAEKFDKLLNDAKRKKPCAALLDTQLEDVCDIPLR